MSAQTRETLKQQFSDQQTATGAKFADLIDSFKMVQPAVSDPAAAGTSVTFIATISQDTEGVITVTKKTVNFSGYQTVAGMTAYQTVAGMSNYQLKRDMDSYQKFDVQKTGSMVVDGTMSPVVTSIEHNMKHYPTVRVLTASGEEIRPKAGLEQPYTVEHLDVNKVNITLDGALNTSGVTYNYVLD